MLYLNTPDKGGETNFMSSRDQSVVSAVAPRTGLALAFDHDITHEGALLEEGIKYCIRTDIMYRRGRDEGDASAGRLGWE
jgi:prolyl 4-hydroxylase